MPKSTKPRKKYRPKTELILDTVSWVKEGFKPLDQHGTYLLDLKIANHGAMAALLQGTAAPKDISTLVAMSNIVESLQQMGFGSEYTDVAVDGRYALLKIAYRATETLRYTPTGEEIGMLNRLMELHDAQMEVITVADMQRGIDRAKAQIRDPKKVIKMPPIPEALRSPKDDKNDNHILYKAA